jgi:cytoskeletal protein RodZ
MGAPHVSGDVGGMLRQARERRGLSLRQIANATKIAMPTLEALERNDITKLPGGIFSRAFVRAYALEVGLEPEIVIEQFIGQFPQDSVTAGHPGSSQIEDHEAVESDRRTASTFLRLFAISIPLAIAVAYFAMAGRGEKTVGSPQAAVGGPQSAVSGRQSTASGEQEGAVGQAGAAAASAPRPAPAEAVAAASSDKLVAAAASDKLVVQVSAARRCWISAMVDGSRVVQREFNPGEEATFEVHKEIALTAGDAGGIAVTFNGLPTRPLGGDGKVVTLRANPTNFRSFLVTP